MRRTICCFLLAAGAAFLVCDAAGAAALETQSNPVANGAITIDADRSDWAGIPEYQHDTIGDAGPPIDYTTIQIANDDTYVYVRYLLTQGVDVDTDGWQYHLYMDTDQNPTTGFNGGWMSVGSDHMIEGASAFAFAGPNQATWGWNWIGYEGHDDTPVTDVEYRFLRASVGDPSAIDFVVQGGATNEDWHPNDTSASYFTYQMGVIPEPASILLVLGCCVPLFLTRRG